MPVKATTALPVKKETPATSKDNKNAPKANQTPKKAAESKKEAPKEVAAPKVAKPAPKVEPSASAAGAAKGWAKIEKGRYELIFSRLICLLVDPQANSPEWPTVEEAKNVKSDGEGSKPEPKRAEKPAAEKTDAEVKPATEKKVPEDRRKDRPKVLYSNVYAFITLS